jgi:hypothetical protein
VIVTVPTSEVETVDPGMEILDVVFDGQEAHLLAVETTTSPGGTEYHFFDKSSNGASIDLGTTSTDRTGLYHYMCGAWARGAVPRVAVATAQVTFNVIDPNRYDLVRLGDELTVVGRFNVYAPTDCSLSPDGRWFVYGNPTGNVRTGKVWQPVNVATAVGEFNRHLLAAHIFAPSPIRL